jgi:hypothetical protein
MDDSVDQLVQALSSMRESDKTKATAAATANAKAWNEVSANLADIVALMERPHPEPKPLDIAALASAFAKAADSIVKGMQAPQVTVAAPQVSVTAPPAVVTVQPAEPVDKAGQQWRIQIERASNSATAPISALVVTRL